MLGLALACTLPAQASESALKLAFAYNFAKFTEWSPTALPNGAPLLLCLARGDSDFAAALTGLHGKVVKGRTARTLVITRPAEADPCHVLMLPAAADPSPAEYVRLVRKTDILTVSDAVGFIDAGGMIQLIRVDNRLQFDINLGATQRAGLKMSSQLLRLAHALR